MKESTRKLAEKVYKALNKKGGAGLGMVGLFIIEGVIEEALRPLSKALSDTPDHLVRVKINDFIVRNTKG